MEKPILITKGIMKVGRVCGVGGGGWRVMERIKSPVEKKGEDPSFIT